MDNERGNYLLSYAEKENSLQKLLGEKLSHIFCSLIRCMFKYSRCFHWFREITLWAIYGINAAISPTRHLWKPKLIKNAWKSCWLANNRGEEGDPTEVAALWRRNINMTSCFSWRIISDWTFLLKCQRRISMLCSADFSFFEDTHASKLCTTSRGKNSVWREVRKGGGVGAGAGHDGKRRLIISMQRTKNICCFYGAGIYCYGFCCVSECVYVYVWLCVGNMCNNPLPFWWRKKYHTSTSKVTIAL